MAVENRCRRISTGKSSLTNLGDGHRENENAVK
jgi:hypothetical protein